jgi:hypothetical protein
MMSSARNSFSDWLASRSRSSRNSIRRAPRRRTPFNPSLEILENRVVLEADTIAAAISISLAPGIQTTISGMIAAESPGEVAANDVDIWKLDLFAGSTLMADIDARDNDGMGSFLQAAGCTLQSAAGPSCLDSILRVFAADGTQLSLSDDATDPDSGMFSFDSSLSVTIPATGSYYVGVSSKANSLYNPNQENSGSGGLSTGEYQLELQVNSGTVPTTPSVLIGDTIVTEGGVAQFAVSLTQPSQSFVTVQFSTSDGTALANGDYVPRMDSITLPPNTIAPQVITVQTINNNDPEPTESFTVNLLSASNATIGDAIGIGTIFDDDPTSVPAIRINDPTIVEGNSGMTEIVFALTLSGQSSQAVMVNFATANDTAQTGDSDYVARTGAVMFLPGELSKSIAIQVRGDTKVEPNEAFFVDLSSAVGATIADNRGVGTIVNDDFTAAPTIAIGDVSRSEGNSGTTDFVFQVTLSAPINQQVTVAYATSNGSATLADLDYVQKSGTVTFAPNDTSETITIQVRGDTKVEPNETFIVTLSSPVGATIADSQGTGTILNDDVAPIPVVSIQISDVAQLEGNSGTTDFVFQVTLSAPINQQVTVAYATSNGSATLADMDYVQKSGTVTFAPNDTSETITIQVRGDTKVEPNETFFVRLTSPAGATLADDEGKASILNDDGDRQATVSFGPDPCDANCNALFVNGTSDNDRIEIKLVGGRHDDDDDDDDDRSHGNGGRSHGNDDWWKALLDWWRDRFDDDDDDDDDRPNNPPSPPMIVVIINGKEEGRFTAEGICRVIVHGHAGNDRIWVSGGGDDDDHDSDTDRPQAFSAWLYGDAGHDVLKGGRGHDVLLGGSGNDELYGNQGRDLLIGGTGADKLGGGSGDDILISGTTEFDANDTALCRIMAEWTSSRSYWTRVKNLRDGSGSTTRANGMFFLKPTTTVVDAGDRDQLTGSSGRDWYFANFKGRGTQDKITGKNGNEVAEDL